MSQETIETLLDGSGVKEPKGIDLNFSDDSEADQDYDNGLSNDSFIVDEPRERKHLDAMNRLEVKREVAAELHNDENSDEEKKCMLISTFMCETFHSKVN